MLGPSPDANTIFLAFPVIGIVNPTNLFSLCVPSTSYSVRSTIENGPIQAYSNNSNSRSSFLFLFPLPRQTGTERFLLVCLSRNRSIIPGMFYFVFHDKIIYVPWVPAERLWKIQKVIKKKMYGSSIVILQHR
jgi:hypothetical protein